MGLPVLGMSKGNTQTSSPASSSSSFLQGAAALGKGALSLNNNGGMAPAPAPTTPVKKTTVTNPNGGSTSTEYHAPPAASLPSAPAAPLASETQPTAPSYNPSQPATTVYNNGVATTNQGGTAVSGYLPSIGQNQSSQTAPNGGNTNTVIPGQLSTYPGLVSGLANTSAQGSPAAQGYTAQTAQYGAGNVPIGQEAAAIGQQYGLDYNAATQAGTSQEGHEMTTGGLSGVGEGNAAVTAGVLAQQQQGIAQSANAAFQGLGVQATTQNQAANAANEAAGQANTGQGLVQSGLGAAGALAQPSATASGQTTFNPLTGQFSGGSSSADPTQAPSGYTQADWSQIVSNVANGNLSAISGLPTVLQAQAQAAAQAQNPNFNINTAEGGASGTQAAAGAAGTTSAGLTQQAAGIQSSANGAEANFTLMQNLATQGGVNNTNVPVLNTLQQNVAKGLTSSAAVASFQALLQSTRSQYATILGGGTSSVEALQEAQSLIPDNISLGALSSLGTNLKSDAANRVAGINQQIQSLSNGSPTVSGSGGSTGNSVSGFGWNG